MPLNIRNEDVKLMVVAMVARSARHRSTLVNGASACTAMNVNGAAPPTRICQPPCPNNTGRTSTSGTFE